MKKSLVGGIIAAILLIGASHAFALTHTEVDCAEVFGWNISGICVASAGPLAVGEHAALTVRLPNAPCFPAVPNGARVTDGFQGYDAVTPPGLWVVNSGRGANRQEDGFATNARLYFHLANDGDRPVENATVAFVWRCGL